MAKTKLVSPDVIFNKLGERFEDWSNWPLKVLGSRKNTFKLSPERYDRNKFLSRQIWRELKEYLKEPNVMIYADTVTWDEDIDESEFMLWDKPFRLSCSSDLLLIEKGTGHGKKLVKREFKVEVPKDKNPLIAKSSGRPPLDVKFLRSILPNVIPYIEGKPVGKSLTKAYAEYFKKNNLKYPPAKSSIAKYFKDEIKQLKEDWYFRP